MKIVQINTTCGIGSTGKISVDISRLLTGKGIENYVIYSSRSDGYGMGISCCGDGYQKLQALKSRIRGNYGFNSVRATKKIIAALDKIGPDIVHLHNIHGHDCNLELLFTYFREKKTKLVWTFHDCWAFTGYCPHFTMVRCDKWQTRCAGCPQKQEYSWFVDRSGSLFDKKKALLQGLDLTIVTPSRWLAELVERSFLKEHLVKIIHNGIDLAVFKPTVGKFREKYAIEPDKKIVLGVAFGWDAGKGLDVFVRLADTLPESYQIVLVGTTEKVEAQLPQNVISIRHTQDQQELAEIYTEADVFVNPTREENYPTVNMEAVACGTPVLTFRTGGSPEMLDETCGSVVACDDIAAMEREITRICDCQPFSKEQCLEKAKGFDKTERFKEYLELYERINASGAEGN
ncbi:MAG: glycosyltransferase [Oscillospiraceae bacterium]|nr:glycosyltransferase [Oscillospiraceae bacterium]